MSIKLGDAILINRKNYTIHGIVNNVDINSETVRVIFFEDEQIKGKDLDLNDAYKNKVK